MSKRVVSSDPAVKVEVAARLAARRRAEAASARLAELRERQEVEAEVEAERKAAREAEEDRRREEAAAARDEARGRVWGLFGKLGMELSRMVSSPSPLQPMTAAPGPVSVDPESGSWRCASCGCHGPDAYSAAVALGRSHEEAVELLRECGLTKEADRAAKLAGVTKGKGKGRS